MVKIRLALLEVFGHGPNEFQLVPNGGPTKPEAILASELDESEAFANAAEDADKNIPEGTLISTVWSQRLHPIISASKKITVIDRFCLRKFQRNNEYFKSAGLRYLICKMKGYPQKHLVVYAGLDDKKEGPSQQKLTWFEVCECLDELNDRYNSNRNCHIEINAFPDSYFKLFHDRFMVFDFQVLELGSGLELLDGPKIWRGITFSLKSRSKDHDRLMEDLVLQQGTGFKWSSNE